jgi:cytochrome c peroxidase
MRSVWKTGLSQFWIEAGQVLCSFASQKLLPSAPLLLATTTFGLWSTGCKTAISEKPVGPAIAIHPPLGLPPVPIPADNPPTTNTIALGRRLFYDPKLSKDNSLACASCHKPEYDFADNAKLSMGVGGVIGVRNAPTILNAAYQPFQFWDGRAMSLEQQAASPIVDPIEMNQPHEVFLSKLAKDTIYKTLFAKAFGTPDITLGRVEKALASFERTALSGNSAFDRYQYKGDERALTPAQVRGLALFINPQKGNCAVCHTLGPQYALFTDGKFHNTGIGVGDEGAFADVGRIHQTKIESEKGAFKTPTLRNISNTAPYMHDGSLQTLRQVVDFYAGGGNSNPYLDKEMKAIHLNGQERSDLVEFLKSLSGEIPPNVGPPGKQ